MRDARRPAKRSGGHGEARASRPKRPRPKFTDDQRTEYEALLARARVEAERRAGEARVRIAPGEPWGSAALRVLQGEGYGFTEWLRQQGFRTERSGIGQGAHVRYPGGVDRAEVAEAWCAGFAAVLEEAGVDTLFESSLD